MFIETGGDPANLEILAQLPIPRRILGRCGFEYKIDAGWVRRPSSTVKSVECFQFLTKTPLTTRMAAEDVAGRCADESLDRTKQSSSLSHKLRVAHSINMVKSSGRLEHAHLEEIAGPPCGLSASGIGSRIRMKRKSILPDRSSRAGQPEPHRFRSPCPAATARGYRNHQDGKDQGLNHGGPSIRMHNRKHTNARARIVFRDRARR